MVSASSITYLFKIKYYLDQIEFIFLAIFMFPPIKKQDLSILKDESVQQLSRRIMICPTLI